MTRSITAARDWVKAHPKRPNGSSWAGWCEALVTDAGDFTNSFSTASLELAHASHLYTPSQVAVGKAPAGWLYHWAYIGDDGVDYGHVAFALDGGLALMASDYITVALGTGVGTIPAAEYATRSGHHFLGSSPDHGGQYLAGVPRSLSAPAKRYHTVVAGDTLSSIAAADHTTWQKVYALNAKIVGRDPDAIVPGEKLLLP